MRQTPPLRAVPQAGRPLRRTLGDSTHTQSQIASIATFYILSETSRSAFDDAQRDQKTVTYNRGLFGTNEIVTGNRFLWEYFGAERISRGQENIVTSGWTTGAGRVQKHGERMTASWSSVSFGSRVQRRRSATADCRLPTADCRLPTVDATRPSA